MRTQSIWWKITGLCAVIGCGGVALAQDTPGDKPPPPPSERKGRPERPPREGDERPEGRLPGGRPMHPQPGMHQRNVPYLGVATDEAGDAMAAQLGLPEGVGLIVDHVEADSPAAVAGLKPFDVIHKIDDQILFNVEQLRNYIRSLKPGQKVKLIAIRKARPLVLEAEIGEHASQPPGFFMMGPGGRDPGMEHVSDLMEKLQRNLIQGGSVEQNRQLIEEMGMILQRMKEVRESMRFSPEQFPRGFPRPDGDRPMRGGTREGDGPRPPGGPRDGDRPPGGPRDGDQARFGPRDGDQLRSGEPDGQSRRARTSSSATASYDDGEHRLTLSITQRDAGPDKHLTAIDKDGNTVFDGGINTPDERAKVPDAIRAKLEKMEKQTQIDVQIRRGPREIPGNREGDGPPGDRPQSPPRKRTDI